MDPWILYIYWIYAMLGLSVVGILWGIKEMVWPRDK
jgi:hypothetical protein